VLGPHQFCLPTPIAPSRPVSLVEVGFGPPPPPFSPFSPPSFLFPGSPVVYASHRLRLCSHVFILHVLTTCLPYTVFPHQSGSSPQLSSYTSTFGRRKSERRRSPMGVPRGPQTKLNRLGGISLITPQVSRSCPYHQSAFSPGLPAGSPLPSPLSFTFFNVGSGPTRAPLPLIFPDGVRFEFHIYPYASPP
jgi:hypothetical protein